MISCFTCRYARKFGRGLITAQVAADKHVRRFPHHVVVRYEVTPVEIFRRDEQPALFGDDEVPF